MLQHYISAHKDLQDFKKASLGIFKCVQTFFKQELVEHINSRGPHTECSRIKVFMTKFLIIIRTGVEITPHPDILVNAPTPPPTKQKI